MSGRIEFTTLTEDDAFEAPQSTMPKSKSGEITPLKDLNSKKQDFRSRVEGLQFIVLLFVIASFCITVALAVEIVIGESQVPSHGAVSSLSATCSDVGVGILKKNGNAVDAAISAMLCLMVVEPQASGLGGGGFVVLHDHKRKDHPASVFDFRESAPQGIATIISNMREEMSLKPGLRVGVPGELLGMFDVSKSHGRLPWSELFTPVIKIAEDGFPVSSRLAKTLKRRVAKEKNFPASFFNVFRNSATNQLYDEGDIMHRRDLASLFRRIANEGVSAFYKGNIAEEIVREVQKNGGVMNVDDFKNYHVISNISPLVGKFLNYTVVTMPAPSSGSLLLYTLKSVETLNVDNPLSTSYMTALTEFYTTKTSKERKSYMFYDLRKTLENIQLTVSNASGFFHLSVHCMKNGPYIKSKTVTNNVDVCETLPHDSIPADDHGTAHVSVIDKNEMLVSFTSSLNNLFGSMIVTPSGILLNDELLDFSNVEQITDPDEKYNFIRPNKKPLSSMVPTIVYQENRPCLLRLSVGGINGSRTLSSVAQTIINMVKFGMDPKTAVDAPKIYCDRDSCEIEKFDGVESLVHTLKLETGIENIQIVEEKLAGIGVASKSQTNVEAYYDSSIDGKASQY